MECGWGQLAWSPNKSTWAACHGLSHLGWHLFTELIAAAIPTAVVDQMQTVPAELGPALGTCRIPR